MSVKGIRMCLNRRVVVGLGVMAAVVVVMHSGLISGLPRHSAWIGPALPLVLLLICPLIMLAMMKGMRRGTDAPVEAKAVTSNDELSVGQR